MDITKLYDVDRIAADAVASLRVRTGDPAIDADDLAQEAALKVLRAAPRFSGEAFYCAQFRVMSFLTYSQIRRRRQTRQMVDDPAVECSATVEVERREFIELAVGDKRYPGQAKIIRLLLEGWTPLEIAGRQGRSLQSVQRTLTAAIKRLRDIYETGVAGDCRMGRCRDTALSKRRGTL